MVMSGKPKVKIMFFCDSKWGGGASAYLYNLISHFDRETFEITLICSRPETASAYFIDKLHDLGVEIIPYKRKKFIPEFYFFWRIFLRRKFQVVSLHDWNAEAILAGKLTGIGTVVFHVHAFSPVKVNYGPLREIIDMFVRKCLLDLAIVTAETNMPLIKGSYGISEKKCFIIPHGVDLKVFARKYDKEYYRKISGLNFPGYIIGIVALLSEMKGHRYLLEAMAYLKKRGINAMLLIIGDGLSGASLESELRFLATKNGIEDKVVFLGFRKDIPEILGAIDVFVLPSLEEMCGIAIIEAMAMSKPIVCSAVGGIPDLIEDRKTGILVEPRDSKAIAEAIAWLINNPKEAEQMSMAAREKAERLYSLDEMVNKTGSLYLGLLRGRYRLRRNKCITLTNDVSLKKELYRSSF